MTAGNPTWPGLFGNGGKKKTPQDIKPQMIGQNKVFFFGKDFNSAVEFLESIGLQHTRSWNCVHNKAGIMGVNNAMIYICPGAQDNPEYQHIMDTLWQGKNNRMIVLSEVLSST